MIKNKLQLVGCACITLMCIACDQPSETENDNETGTTQKPQEALPKDKQVDSNISPNNKHAKYAAAQTKIVIPETCAQIPSKNACDKTLGCTFKGKCQEDTSLTTTLCGPKGMKECLESEECNYSDLIGKCFDKNVVKGKPKAPATCAEIDETFSDAKKECNKTIGCKYTNGKCKEDTTLTMAHCKGKSEQNCRIDHACTWASRLQKCYLESGMTGLTWNSCAEAPAIKCNQIPGCAINGATGTCHDDPAADGTDCNAHDGNEDACRGDTRCYFAAIRGAAGECFKKPQTLAIGAAVGCAKVPLDGCAKIPGCKANVAGTACEDVDFTTIIPAPHGGGVPGAHPNIAACAHAADSNACNRDIRCVYSAPRNDCVPLFPSFATGGLTGCANVPLDSCPVTHGCQVNAGACEDVDFTAHANQAACHTYVGNFANCVKDARCAYSAPRSDCLPKHDADPLATGMITCSDIPLDVCGSVSGCRVNGAACDTALGLTHNAPCDANHDNPGACLIAGCAYSPFVSTPGAMPAAMGACFDPPGYARPPAGFCHLKTPNDLETFCHTQDANNVQCAGGGGLKIGGTNACVHTPAVVEACNIMDTTIPLVAPMPRALNGDLICKKFQNILETAGVNNTAGANLTNACNAIQIQKSDLSAYGQACRWDGGTNTCKARHADGYLVTAADGDNAAAYCAAMMALGAAGNKATACMGLATIQTADVNSASIKGMSVCAYKAPVAATCTPDPAANALCVGLAEGNGAGECQDATRRHGAANSANVNVCSWQAFP